MYYGVGGTIVAIVLIVVLLRILGAI